MIVNDVFFASQIEIWETAFHNCSHIYKIDKDMPLTLWLVWLLPFLFLWLFFSTEILFFASNRNPPSRKISRFRSLYRLSSNNSKKNTNDRHLPLTGTDHCNFRFLKILFFRETITHFRTTIFSQSSRFQFPSPILDRLYVSFNVITSSRESSSSV